MKNYIKPAIKVKEMAYDTQICDTSVAVSNDTIINDETQIYARPHFSSLWDDDEEEDK